MNCFEQRQENDQFGLSWVDRFGWIRTLELGRLLWPGDRFSRTRTDRVVRGWRERHLILERTLPSSAGRAIVLAEAGARLLREMGIDATSGKDFGEITGDRWMPPASWQHDLIAAGILSKAYEQGNEILPERFLRRRFPNLTKYPDGVWYPHDKQAHAIWLEVESARKSGKAMQELAQALIAVSQGHGPTLGDIRPSLAAVAYLETARDDRGYSLNHRQRVAHAIQVSTHKDCRVTWIACSLKGFGLDRFNLEPDVIPADRVSKILKTLDASGWTPAENQVFEAYYGKHKVSVWNYDEKRWCSQMDDGHADFTRSKADAKRRCAELLVDASM